MLLPLGRCPSRHARNVGRGGFRAIEKADGLGERPKLEFVSIDLDAIDVAEATFAPRIGGCAVLVSEAGGLVGESTVLIRRHVTSWRRALPLCPAPPLSRRRARAAGSRRSA